MSEFKYDEIGYWSEVKLAIVNDYASAYSKIMHKQSSIRKYLYIDAFSGAGHHILKSTGDFVLGSSLNALKIAPAFNEYHLIDLDRGKINELQQQVGERQDVFFYNDDANRVLLDNVFPRCLHQDYHRALCLLDPYALTVDWKVLQTAGKMESVEVFYNFMIMDANMNVFLRNPDKVAPEQAIRMDKVWGNRTWRTEAYIARPTLWGDTIDEKAPNEDIADCFRQRLIDVAKFKYVPKPMPMRNEKGSVIYYLFFASPNKTGAGIVEDIFNTYRNRGMK